MDGESVVSGNSGSLLDDLPDISNVCIFMADALRWDYLPAAIDEMGVTARTVASSLATHTSLPSMFTGLWPERHGVLSWHDRLPDVPHLLDIPGYDGGYFMPGEDAEEDGTFAVLGVEHRRRIEQLRSPWIYFERHHGGHAPFGAAGWEGTWQEFVDAFAGDTEKHVRWYRRAIDAAVDDFERRLETIEKAGEREETLVIFTSDHGEYLGEAGLVDHSSPIRPEGVYVPTVFVHPDLEDATMPHVIRHVDLLPTVLDVLEGTVRAGMDGVSLLRSTPTWGYTRATSNIYVRGRPRRIYDARSVWDMDGGWVRNDSGVLGRLLTTASLVGGSRGKSRHLRRHYRQIPAATGHYLRKRQRYGEPGISYDDAVARIEEVERRDPVQGPPSEDISPETRARLEEMGYL